MIKSGRARRIMIPKTLRTGRGSTMASPKTDRSERYTYADYLTWDGDERWELIDGVPYLMASPIPEHQQAALQLGAEFAMYLRGKECRAFISPMDLTVETNMRTQQVVQPDLFVMCGEYGQDKRIVGVPVLVIEILSPSTAGHDFVRKMRLYQRIGVQEYWIVDPVTRFVYVYKREGDLLQWHSEHKPGDTLSPSMFPDLSINVSVLFE